MTYNSECGICKTPLTVENTKPGFGVCDCRDIDEHKSYGGFPKIYLHHKLVCLECSSQAKEINETNGVFVDSYDPTENDLIYRSLGYDPPQINIR
jgi:hypothetical protein